jgi:hypothetical protein
MPLIKSNSALLGFDLSGFENPESFVLINYLQSLSLDVKVNRLNNKSIGNSEAITNQFVEPEITLSLNFLQAKDFLNEMIFGFEFSSSISDEKFLINKLFNNSFCNLNSFILFSDIQGNDLIYSSLNNSMSSISIGNLYLENYSFNYRIREIPTATVNFSCNNLKIEKISDALKLKAWNESEIQLSNSMFDDLKSITSNAERLVYVMNGLSSSSNFNSSSNIGPNISNLLSGIIQSLDCSINFNRNKLYFFNGTNNAQDRKIILPVAGNLKISGISNEFDIGNIKSFFESNSSFSISIDILDEVKNPSSTIIYNKLFVESFSYSINLNGFLEYSLDCSFQLTDKSGIKILKVGKPSGLFQKIQTSDLDHLKSSDGFFIYTNNVSSIL